MAMRYDRTSAVTVSVSVGMTRSPTRFVTGAPLLNE
jgi:hypothetical protein